MAQRGLIQKAMLADDNTTIIYRLLLDDASIWKKSYLSKPNPQQKEEQGSSSSSSSSSSMDSIIQELYNGGCQDISTQSESSSDKLIRALVTSLPFLFYLAFLYKLYHRLQTNKHSIDDDHTTSSPLNNNNNNNNNNKSKPTFNDIAGLSTITLQNLQDIILYIQNPIPHIRIGANPPRGILLYGPPGNGKTLLARIVYGESNADAFVSCSGSDFVELYVGNGAKRIRALLGRVRREALCEYQRRRRKSMVDEIDGKKVRWFVGSKKKKKKEEEKDESQCTIRHRPPVAIVFIDEIDTLAKCRDGIGRSNGMMGGGGGIGGNDEREQTLNALLTEMDGFQTPTRQHQQQDQAQDQEYDESDVIIILIGATNRPSVLDPAILRPGRFDRHVLIPHPDMNGRKDILRLHLGKIRLEEEYYRENNEELLLGELASEDVSASFSGADIRALVNEAALNAVRGGCEFVGRGHLMDAARMIRETKVLIF